MARDNFKMQEETIQSSATKTASGNSEFARSTVSARTFEVWVNLATVAVGTTITFSFDTTQDGTNYVSQKITSGITTAGRYTYILNRVDHALGKSMRVSWTLASAGTPSVTMDIVGMRME